MRPLIIIVWPPRRVRVIPPWSARSAPARSTRALSDSSDHGNLDHMTRAESVLGVTCRRLAALSMDVYCIYGAHY